MAQNTVNTVICRADAKNKVFDMRDGLNLAYPEDYAMIHGTGGAKHASVSGITLTITDYSEGTGDRSKFAHANIPPFLVDQMLSVCRQNAGTRVDGSGYLANALSLMNSKLDKLVVTSLTFFSKAVSACGSILKGKGHEAGPFADFGKVLKETRDVLATDGDVTAFAVGSGYTDYAYHQERVNMYRKDPKDGYVFVSVVDIARKQFSDKGEPRRLTWQVKIKNLWAQPREMTNGTTAYNSGTARDVVETFIQISDDDMYRCCYAVDHFVRVWENANGIPLVLDGLQRRKQQRQG